MNCTSRWRLVTSADSPAAARASAVSVLAGLLPGEEVEFVVAPYFRGGFQAEWFLDHADCDEAERFVASRLDLLAIEWSRTEAPGDLLHAWTHGLNVPRADALEVLVLDAEAEAEEDPADELPPAPPLAVAEE